MKWMRKSPDEAGGRINLRRTLSAVSRRAAGAGVQSSMPYAGPYRPHDCASEEED